MGHEHLRNKENEIVGGGHVDSRVSITCNPFDILNNVVYTKSATEPAAAGMRRPQHNDDYFVSALIRSKGQMAAPKPVVRRSDIFTRLQVFSGHELAPPIKKYFKFPFDHTIKNDDSMLYHKIYRETLQSVSFAYSNYRRFNENFKVKINKDLVFFEKIIKATKGLEDILLQNDIQYEENDGLLFVESNDANFVYDLIMNIQIAKDSVLPFILSECEFDNAIVYHTSVEKGPIVRMGNRQEFTYYINGPLFSGDYLLENATEIRYIE